jgi:hypothetical protein
MHTIVNLCQCRKRCFIFRIFSTGDSVFTVMAKPFINELTRKGGRGRAVKQLLSAGGQDQEGEGE